MELVPCPKCGDFNDAEAAECAQCHAPLDAEPEAAPPAHIALAPLEEAAPPEEPPAAVVEEAPPPAPFDAPPEVRAKVGRLEAEIAQKPNAPAVHLQLAKVYLDANRKDLAVGTLERFLAVDPTNAYVRHKHAQLTGVPEAAPHVPATPARADANPPPPSALRGAGTAAPPSTGVARTGQTSSFQTGLAQRPAAAPVSNMMRTVSGRTKAIIAGSLAFALVAIAAKVWLFPDTEVLVKGDFRAFGPSWSPSGKQLAFVLDDGRSTRLAVYDFGAGSFRPLAAAAVWDARGFAWSPDGRQIAYTGEGGGDEGGEAVHVVDVASGQSRRVAAGSSPSWASDGQTILTTCGPERPAVLDETSFSAIDWTPRFCTVNAVTGDVRRGGAVAEYGMTVSPLLQKAVSERYAETGAEAGRPPSSGEGEFQDMTQSLAESGARNVAQGSRNLSREVQARQYMERRKAGRDAARLPYGADVLVTDIGNGSAVEATRDGQSAYASWTPDGARILFATNGASGIEMWTMNADGGDRRLVVPGRLKIADPSSVTLSRDGRDVFFIAPVPGDPGLAKLMTGESPADLHVARAGESVAKRLSNRHPFKQRFAVSPNGKRIAYEVLQDVKLVGGAQKSEIWLLKR
jgi:Tol biopolymer transport system component